jgi:hypothetical protein
VKPSTDRTRIIQDVKVVPQEPEEFLVQRLLTSVLAPGWCLTAPAGSEPKTYQKRRLMFWRIALMLMLLWLLGLATSYPMGGLIHVVLVVAILMFLLGYFEDRRLWLIKADQARGPTRDRTVADLADPDALCRFEGEGGAQVTEPATLCPAPYHSFAAAIGDGFGRRRPVQRITQKTNISKCPHCGVKLGNFLYADRCPHCHEELKHNTKRTFSAPAQDSRIAKLWPIRIFKRFLRFVES